MHRIIKTITSYRSNGNLEAHKKTDTILKRETYYISCGMI